MSNTLKFPPDWDEERVRRVLEHYESQDEDEAVAEDEAAVKDLAQPESEQQWDGLFARPESQDLLERLADETLSKHRAGRTCPLSFEE